MNFIVSDEQLVAVAEFFNIEPTIEDVSSYWHLLTGEDVYDYRPNSEYTNVAAQDDRDFYYEEPL